MFLVQCEFGRQSYTAIDSLREEENFTENSHFFIYFQTYTCSSALLQRNVRRNGHQHGKGESLRGNKWKSKCSVVQKKDCHSNW